MPLRVLTNSELKVFRRCACEHRFAYGLGYRPVHEATPLRFGSVVHTALEAWWKESILLPGASAEQRLQAALASLPDAADPFELVRAVEMLHGYTLRWGGERYDVLAVECEFRAPLINPYTRRPSRTFELGGKIDAIARDLSDGRVYIVEHKTSSEDVSPGSNYWQCLRLDAQVSMYYRGARALGYDVSGVVYDVLGKPKHVPSKATPIEKRQYRKDGGLYATQRASDETPREYQARVREAMAEEPDRYFARGTVVRLEDEESLAAWDAWQLAQQIREGDRFQRYPRNTDSCKRWGRLCSYFGVCTKTESLEDANAFRRVEDVHEELSAPELAP